MIRVNTHRFGAIPTLALVELLTIALVASTAAPVLAQATFEKAIATPGSSYAQDAEQTFDGGYVVGANYCAEICYFALLSKLDSSGNLQWQKRYQLPGFQTQLNASRQTSDGGYVWAGYLPYFNGCPGCAFVAKLDSNGNIQWQNSYRGLDVAQANDIGQTTGDGGYVIAGNTAPSQFGTRQAWIAKLDSFGNVQWQKSLSDSNNACYGAFGNSLQQTTGGGFVLVGYTSVYPWKVLVVKVDSNGNVKWQTRYSSSGAGSAGCGIQQTSDGGYIVGGYNTDVSAQNALALKLDSSGKVQWAKTFGASGATTSQFNSVRPTTDGGYVFSGYFYNSGDKSWIVRTDSNGNVQWQKTYGKSTAVTQFNKVTATSGGGLIAVGHTNQFNSAGSAYIVKADSGGNVANCHDLQSTTATVRSVSFTSSSARLSISAPTNLSESSFATASSTSLTPTNECP
jgi:hypothetical protein